MKYKFDDSVKQHTDLLTIWDKLSVMDPQTSPKMAQEGGRIDVFRHSRDFFSLRKYHGKSRKITDRIFGQNHG